jgi:nitrite reductase (NO-forming)
MTGAPTFRDAVRDGDRTSVLPVLTLKAELTVADAQEVHLAYAPNVPPTIVRDAQRIVEVHFEVLEAVCEIDPKTGTKTETWGYRIAGDTEVRCGVPGPVLRARVGDMLRITLTNLLENTEPHNIDFHAVTGPGGGAKALTVAPGETATMEARLLYPGVFMYHCAYGDPPKHVTYGMVGMVIVDPETPLPSVEHEWAVMQSEWYLTEPDAEGIAVWDRDAVLAEEPRFITYNGRTDALTGENALAMRTGERARIYFANQGLALNANFHAIGSHWDVVYPEGATTAGNPVIRGSQTTLIAAGGGTVVELVAHVPGNIILVDHALSRTFAKGAIGIIAVSGPDNPEIFATSGEAANDSGDAHDAAGPVREIVMDAGSYFYSLDEIHVRKGERIRLTINNTGGTHDLVIDELGVKTNRIETGEKASVEFTADTAGSFVYYCSVGDHRLRGQWGTLIVEE